MRTTVTLADDVAVALDRLCRERGLGPSEAINELIRAGFQTRPPQRKFRQRSRSLGLRIDVSNVAEALEVLEGRHPG